MGPECKPWVGAGVGKGASEGNRESTPAAGRVGLGASGLESPTEDKGWL